MYKVILASASQHRAKLMRRLGIDFSVYCPNIDESALENERAVDLVERLAKAKAAAYFVAHNIDANTIIIASDQVGELDHHILGKPNERDHAIAQLSQMRGRDVMFYTAMAVGTPEHLRVSIDTTKVIFRDDLTDEEIARYVDKEQPFCCCGSFQAEGLGIALTSSIQANDPSSLVGLPLIQLCADLREFGIVIP